MAPIADRLPSRGGRDGAIAQLGERVVRNDEVGGSIPPGSTTLLTCFGLPAAQPCNAEGRSVVPGVTRLGEDGPVTENLFPRKPRRPLLHEAGDAFTEITAAQ